MPDAFAATVALLHTSTTLTDVPALMPSSSHVAVIDTEAVAVGFIVAAAHTAGTTEAGPRLIAKPTVHPPDNGPDQSENAPLVQCALYPEPILAATMHKQTYSLIKSASYRVPLASTCEGSALYQISEF